MKTKTIVIIVVCAFFWSYLAKVTLLTPDQSTQENATRLPKPTPNLHRIVSLAPSVTEILFAIGVGERVVGVTRYCDYPPEAKEKGVVGGFLDPNYEAIVRLEPDLAVILDIQSEPKEHLESIGIEVLQVDHRTLEGILNSITLAGEACGAQETAVPLVVDIRARIEVIRQKTLHLKRPRVLISAGRTLGTGRLEEVFAAGRNEWYDDIIQLAGGTNAIEGEEVQFPVLTSEGLLRLDPDIVIEMAPDLDNKSFTAEDIVQEWDVLSELVAVKKGGVYVLSGGHVTIPGPRVIRIIEDLAHLIHPDVDWETKS
jgi:iron complex transport system substrate-binding protein